MDWSPMSEEQRQHYPLFCIRRIQREIMNIIEQPPPGILAIAEESDITLVHALIIGPSNTPYEGGFFYFLLRYTPDYPLKPPKVKFMTTGGSTVRFNPNLYKNGKVCLSILGTWDGPGWSPAQTLASVLISIQSLLNETPYHNEPKFENYETHPGDARRYNEIIQHETLRVAVIGMVDNDFGLYLPLPFQDAIKKMFLDFYDTYTNLARNNIRSTGTLMLDPFGDNSRGQFAWGILLGRLENIHGRLKNTGDSNPNVSEASCVHTLCKH